MIQESSALPQKFVTTLLIERLAPGPVAAAVFWGVFIGIAPIYGLQTLTALGVAILFRLNKPRVGRRPLMLSAEQYRNALIEAGMQVEMRRLRNLLPFVHILFLARRVEPEVASGESES